MKLSNLQKYILDHIWASKKTKVNRHKFMKFYDKVKKAPNKELQIKIISRSLERLINRGILVGFGERTKHKRYIKEVKFTPVGRKIARKLQGEQVELPFKKRKRPASPKTSRGGK